MKTRPTYRAYVFFALICSGLLIPHAALAEAPVALRVQHFTVPPATGPVIHVLITNLREEPYTGTVRIKLPDTWVWRPDEQVVSLAAYETKRLPFTLEKAINLGANVYPVEVSATGAGKTVAREQTVVCASAPYGKPSIDGNLEDWNDSLPVTFTKDGKKTVMRTLWNRRTFYLAVEVEESAWSAGDAIQFSIAPMDALTGTTPEEPAARYEFLVTKDSSCCRLIAPGMALSTATVPRTLETLETVDTEVVIVHKEGTTFYECAIPFSAMKDIRPSEGREFSFSLLVHDPDGTGLRDWGEAAGLSPDQRTPLAWCLWNEVKWGPQPPYDNTIEWGLCSSIH